MPVRTLAVIVLVILIGYGAIKAWPLLSGPSITLSSPEDYASLPDGYLHIKGVAKHTESLLLDGAQLLITQDGAFDKILLLPPGGAIITLTATDRFGRSTTIRRTVTTP